MSEFLLAIDAGTGSIRAVLFDTLGNQIFCAQEEWTHEEDERFPGSMNFNWKHNWDLACSCVKKVIESDYLKSGSIKAISTTCMREGIVLYNKNGEEIWACANVDSRSEDEVANLIHSFPELEKQLYHKTGQSFALDAIPRLLWVKNKLPDVYSNIDKLGMFNDWLIYKMTGELYVEPSNGSTTGLIDLTTRDWDLSIAETVGIRTDIFPPIKESGTIAGYTSNLFESATGVPTGTPVVVGGGDCQLGCIGVGAVYPNEAAVFGGSFWQYEFNTDQPITDNQGRVRVNCHAIPNQWQFEALAFKPGLVLRWYRDAFCQDEKLKAKELNISTYDLLNEKAKNIPAGCYGMMCTFSDVMNFITWKHAACTFTNFNLDASKYSKYTFYKAILENTCLITKGHIELIKECTGNIPDEIIFAGGASKSDLWPQILADVLGIKVKVPVVKEATALGAAILAGYGVGIYSNVSQTAKEIVKIEKEFLPNKENTQVYNEAYKKWKLIYEKQLQIANEGLTQHMWKAPGI